MTDHDQRIKELLRLFLPEFFEAYFPAWAARFDFSTTEWLDKEVFPDPPGGRRLVADLVARLGLRDRHEAQRPDDRPDELLALIHVEIEGGTAAALRPRMYAYYESLRRAHRVPVLPVALLLNAGLDGIGRDAFEERFWDLPVLRFEYLYVGLPALDGAEHIERGNVLDVALASLMRLPEDRKPHLRAEALRRIIESDRDDWQKYLLGEFVQTYLDLDPTQDPEFDRLVTKEGIAMIKRYHGLTWGEQGEIKALRRMATRQLEAKFGPLSDRVRERINEMSISELDQFVLDFVGADSLEELGLGE